jgi:Beta-ketoacyl synthase, N-terminal domain
MHTRSATALQSMEIASDTILSGKAKVMVAGGFDDLCEEGSYEFGNMKATSNSETELAMGREPTEMSRPTTTTRAGVRTLMFLIQLLSAYLITFSSWNLKVSVYTLSCQPRLPLSLAAQFAVYFPSPLHQRESYLYPIIK